MMSHVIITFLTISFGILLMGECSESQLSSRLPKPMSLTAHWLQVRLSSSTTFKSFCTFFIKSFCRNEYSLPSVIFCTHIVKTVKEVVNYQKIKLKLWCHMERKCNNKFNGIFVGYLWNHDQSLICQIVYHYDNY